MKIALAQIDIKPSKTEENIFNVTSYINQAKQDKCDIVCFPEMCISGYLIGDKWLSDDYCEDLMELNQKIIEQTDDICVIWGNVYLDKRETLKSLNGFDVKNIHHDGRLRRYNAAYVYENRKPATKFKKISYNSGVIPEGVIFKTLLPNYRYFDDKRYFSSPLDLVKDNVLENNDIFTPFMISHNKQTQNNIESEEISYFGVEICEDLWCEDYNINPTKHYKNLCDVIFNISSSPWTYNKNFTRDKKVKQSLGDNKGEIKFCYVNCVGSQNNGKNILTFDGASTVYNEKGNIIKLANSDYKEELLIVTTNKSYRIKKRKEKTQIERKYQAITRGIKHITETTGIDKFVIGLSGGVDSAVVSCLLTDTVGKDKVFAYNMPSIYNSKKTIKVASQIAEKLQIQLKSICIDSIESSVKNSIIVATKTYDDVKRTKQSLKDITKENIQAKIRGTDLLSNISQELGALFTNNGNKVETAIGYATLYGDVGGAIAPIADLTKSEVYDMARYINEKAKDIIIPNTLIPDKFYQFSDKKIKPTAELKQNQTDPIKIGYHCALIEKFFDYKKVSPTQIMQWWLDKTLANNLGIDEQILINYNLLNPDVFIDDLEWFCNKIENSVFKRIQSPPIIVTSKTSFGYDLRESILTFTQTSKFKRLKKEILNIN